MDSADTNPTDERWCPVAGFEGMYEVSDAGAVRRVGAGGRDGAPRCLVSTHHKRRGRVEFVSVGLRRNGRATLHVSLARLVLCAFVGQPPHPRALARTRDGDPINCALSNLYWTNNPEGFGQARVSQRQRAAYIQLALAKGLGPCELVQDQHGGLSVMDLTTGQSRATSPRELQRDIRRWRSQLRAAARCGPDAPPARGPAEHRP